jgi:hypothetical protein
VAVPDDIPQEWDVNPDHANTASPLPGSPTSPAPPCSWPAPTIVRRQRRKLARQADVVKGYADELHDEMEHNDRLQVENEGLHRDLRALRAENTDLLEMAVYGSPS